jgi:hypothetical protein
MGSARRIDISAAVSDTVAVIQRRGIEFVAASLFLTVLPDWLSLYLRRITPGRGFSPLEWAVYIVAFALSLVFQAGVFSATSRELDGKTNGLNNMLRAGFKYSLPLFGLTLLVAIPVTLGLILIIVPGVLLFLRWSVAGPAMVTEQFGVFAAMRRSAELTKGRLWEMFLAYLVSAAVLAVIEVAYIAAAGGLSGIRALGATRVVTPYTLLMLAIVRPLLSVVMSIGFDVFVAALFYQLRTRRDGAATAALTEVFA